MADFTNIASKIKSLKEQGAGVVSQKNFIQITNPNGVRMYVAQPGKNGSTRVVHLAEHGYGGTLAGQPVGNTKLETQKVPGAVAFAYDLDSDGGKFFDELVQAFMTLKPEASPRGRSRRTSAPPIDVEGLLGLREDQGSEPAASGRASSDAWSDASE